MKIFPFISRTFFLRQARSLVFFALVFLIFIQTGHSHSVFGENNSSRSLPIPREFRVGLVAQYRNAASVSISNTAINVSYDGVLNVSLNSSDGFTATPDPSGGVLLSWGREAMLFDKRDSFPQLSDGGGGTIKLGSRSYRGRIELFRNPGGNLQPINVISVDEYLYSVVPSEMPSGWPLEALKAQAVAARSYSCTRAGIHEDLGYDLCDASHCQNYIGASGESSTGIQAVQATSGLVVSYENEPINAVYFSSSGGVTADSGDVWVNQFPYLSSVQEIHEPDGKVWSRSFTLSELTSLLSANNVNIGQAVSVSIDEISSGGRVNRLVIRGTGGSKTLEKEDIRNFFSPSSGGSLESRNFTISNGSMQSAATRVAVSNGQSSNSANAKGLSALSIGAQAQLEQEPVYVQGGSSTTSYSTAATAVTSEGNDIVFSGRGWGHGVGMSQYGAKGMAESGYDFREILEHYYTGARVR